MLRSRANVGGLDRLSRLVFGGAALIGGFAFPGLLGDVLAAQILGSIGVAFVATGVLAYCPLYELAGISTGIRNACESESP